MDLFKQLFQIGDIIASFNDRGEYLDKPVLIIGVKNNKGWYTYTTIRQDEESIRVNGTIAMYTQASVARFKVIGHNPAAQVLYSTKES